MELFSQFSGFDWDEANREKNWLRHNVTWWECEEVFFNQPLYVFPDKVHSTSEERYYALGKTNTSRLLLIVFTRRGNKIRVISARDMHKKERKVYHEKAKKDSQIYNTG
jgi:uncharacterized DUF497 family protein